MIIINCIRIKKLLQQQNKSIEDLRNIFILHSHDTDSRLNDILHNSFVKDRYLDTFVYEIARELNVCVDYLYGWVDDPLRFIEQKNQDVNNKQMELLRLLNKYCNELGIERKNTNILAYETNVDREVFDYMYSGNRDWAWTISTSYYIISKWSLRFNFNYYTVLAFLIDAEEDSVQEQNARYLGKYFEEEYQIKTI